MNEISKPSHYIEGRHYEPRDVILDWELSYCLGNALKYIARAGRKESEITDLRKAINYLEREIQRIQERTEKPFLKNQEEENDKNF